jgi:hypothetical protein
MGEGFFIALQTMSKQCPDNALPRLARNDKAMPPMPHLRRHQWAINNVING